MLEIGSTAPHFCLPNQDETEICLRDLSGKWIILYFYPKDNTAGCSAEACDFSENINDFENQDAIIIGVSPDSPKKHKNFIAKKGLKIILLSDENKEVLNLFGVWKLKKMFGKEYFGVERSTYIITPDNKIAFVWGKVRVKGHIQKVKEKLKELKEKKK